MAVLGKVVWFTGDWVGFSLPNVMVIEEAKGKSMMDTYKTRRSQEAAERQMSIRYTVMRGMTWEEMNKENLRRTDARCKKYKWEANVDAEKIGVDVQPWWSVDTSASSVSSSRAKAAPSMPPVVKSARVGAGSTASSSTAPAAPLARDCMGPQAPDSRRTVMLVSFGTRTLAEVFHFVTNWNAIAMKGRLWPRHQRRLQNWERARLFQNEEAKAAVLHCLPDLQARDVTVHLVDCTRLHEIHEDGSGRGNAVWGHVGTHPSMMQGFMEQPEMRYIYDRMRRILPQVEEGGNHVIAFYCNAGEHRSVAVREFVRYCLCDATVVQGAVAFSLASSDLCKALWDRRGCGQCSACSTSPVSQVRTDAQMAFVRGLYEDTD